jgi:hypothetical protein
MLRADPPVGVQTFFVINVSPIKFNQFVGHKSTKISRTTKLLGAKLIYLLLLFVNPDSS